MRDETLDYEKEKKIWDDVLDHLKKGVTYQLGTLRTLNKYLVHIHHNSAKTVQDLSNLLKTVHKDASDRKVEDIRNFLKCIKRESEFGY